MDARKILTPPFQYCSQTSEYLLTKESWTSMAVLLKENCSLTEQPKVLSGRIKDCFGFLGIFHLQFASYLAVISEAKYVGSLNDCSIFMISEIEFLPMTSIKDQDTLTALKLFIESNFFYFSYGLNLTNSISRIVQYRDPMTLESSDYRFCWNYNIQEEFGRYKVQELVLPVISGFVQIEHSSVEGQTIDFGIITRRDHRRAGTRFHTRGLNTEGNAANFAETEQVVAWNDSGKYIVNSFVQIRGSIPLLWTQKPNLSWTPHVKLNGSTEAGRRHHNEIQKLYKKAVYLNLVDQKGSQRKLGNSFEQLVSSLGENLFVWFDFHKECKNMKYENLSKLIESLNEALQEFGWTEVEIPNNKQINEGTVKKNQTGVIRTNCIDCLDRTNVAQSVLARVILQKQLASLGYRSADPMGSFPANLEFCFRNFWTNNADIISLMYSGTNAMKTDFTRTGKRTTVGAMNDSKYGITRYFINNFYDGTRKNLIDLFLGKIRKLPNQGSESKIKLFTFVMLLLISLLFCYSLAGKVATGYLQPLIFTIFTFGFYKFILPVIGKKIVEKPSLD